jgi:hypothetical protein
MSFARTELPNSRHIPTMSFLNPGSLGIQKLVPCYIKNGN